MDGIMYEETDNISPTLNFSEKISTFPKQNAL